MKLRWTAVTAMLVVCACSSQPEEAPHNASPTVANVVEPAAPANSIASNAPANDHASLAEPRGPIDPKGTEAAGQAVQHYGALIEQRRFGEAEKLWSDAASARETAGELKRYSEVHLEIGDLGDPEGAAGSIYATMPVVFYGEASAGASFRRKAEVVLRRVNDVPGSTEEQRRWHIERIDWDTRD